MSAAGSESALNAPPLNASLEMRVLLPFLLTTLIWSSTWIAIRGQLGVVAPIWSVTYRFLLASAVLFAFVAVRREPLRLPRAAFGLVAVLAVTQFVLNYVFVYTAESHVTSGLVAVVYALLVVPNAFLSWLWLRQGVSRRFLVGSMVALLGLALMFAHELGVSGAGGHAAFLGIGYSLLGVLAASIANVAQATERAGTVPKATLLAYSMALGALIDGVLAWVMSGPPTFDPSPLYIGCLLYLGILGSSVAFVLYLVVIRAIGPARAAYSGVLVPILAMAISTIFEHYVWGVAAALGGALTLAGLVVAIRARSPAR